MKWKSKQYQIGDKKTVKHFAFLPVRIGERMIWLESYYSDYEYVDRLCFSTSTAYILKWMWLRDYK